MPRRCAMCAAWRPRIIARPPPPSSRSARPCSGAADMGYLRLRQICLVAAALEPALAQIEQVIGLAICHRDGNVAKYGLVNALFPVGAAFLEVVAPTREGTAAGRYLERRGGDGGYMVILDCDDIERR